MKGKIKSLVRVLTVGAIAVPLSALAADNATVTAGAEFLDTIGVTVNTHLDFGYISTGIAVSETMAIATTGSLTDSAGDNGIGGTLTAADLTVTSTASEGLTITVDTVSPGTNYTLGSFVCDFESAGSTACDSPLNVTAAAGGSSNLKIGATLTQGASSQTAQVNDGSFKVTMTYQ